MPKIFKLVENRKEEEVFNKIYRESFEEMNYELVDNIDGVEDAMSYLVRNSVGEFAGTVQFVPFDRELHKTSLVNPGNFLKYSEIQDNLDFVYEIDKLSVLADERRGGVLQNIMEVIKVVSKEQNAKYLIAEMNPLLCRALKIEFGVTVQREKMVRNEKYGYAYVPTVINLETAIHEYENKIKQKEMACV